MFKKYIFKNNHLYETDEGQMHGAYVYWDNQIQGYVVYAGNPYQAAELLKEREGASWVF